MIYKFEDSYSGHSQYAYGAPEPGEPHRCLLFLAQDVERPDYDRAKTECEKYGFEEVVFSGHEKLQSEFLNSDAFRGLAGFYEEAMEKGSSIAFYPNP